eukprot:311952-Alexandrium_andersonii.AAC.1
MPKALLGGMPTAKSGQRICFGYNLNQCKDAKPGASCKRGLHVCCRPGREKQHPASERAL